MGLNLGFKKVHLLRHGFLGEHWKWPVASCMTFAKLSLNWKHLNLIRGEFSCQQRLECSSLRDQSPLSGGRTTSLVLRIQSPVDFQSNNLIAAHLPGMCHECVLEKQRLLTTIFRFQIQSTTRRPHVKIMWNHSLCEKFNYKYCNCDINLQFL